MVHECHVEMGEFSSVFPSFIPLDCGGNCCVVWSGGPLFWVQDPFFTRVFFWYFFLGEWSQREEARGNEGANKKGGEAKQQ